MPVVNRGSDTAEFTLLITTERSVITLSDGVPLTLRYDGPQDLSKFMIFSLPEGNQTTVQILVKSKKEYFFPTLYYKYYEDIESAKNTIAWPPGGDNFFRIKNWDQ